MQTAPTGGWADIFGAVANRTYRRVESVRETPNQKHRTYRRVESVRETPNQKHPTYRRVESVSLPSNGWEPWLKTAPTGLMRLQTAPTGGWADIFGAVANRTYRRGDLVRLQTAPTDGWNRCEKHPRKNTPPTDGGTRCPFPVTGGNPG